ncbi:hypothetical protein KJ693_11920 [bacterium]|nr:hypothetical protein [bacterium]MBU1615999.1 hypothetical protein [bacterium]
MEPQISNLESRIEEDEINLLDYLIVLAKHKRFIVGITLSVAIFTAIISLIIPPTYRAEAKILPPQQGSSSMAAQLLGQLGGAASMVGGAVGIKSTSDLYIGLLKSRSVLDRIIDRFNLMELYEAEFREDARENLVDVLSAQTDKSSDIITIGVEDKNPKMAADMANAFIKELKNLNKRLAVTEACQRRLFFEEQLKEAKDTLIKSEESMKGFQERTGAIKIDEQTKVTIESVAQLGAQIAAKEVQLKVIRTYTTSHNPDLQKAEEELKGLKAELLKLGGKGGYHSPDAMISTGKIPEVGTEYIRKLREFKYNETLYEIFLKAYETAKLDEARDALIIQVIDKAIPPEKRAKPKRTLMVMMAIFAGFFFSVFAAFSMEYIEKSSKDATDKERFEALRKYLAFRHKN